jgi:hypothetical protein
MSVAARFASEENQRAVRTGAEGEGVGISFPERSAACASRDESPGRCPVRGRAPGGRGTVAEGRYLVGVALSLPVTTAGMTYLIVAVAPGLTFVFTEIS